MKARDVFLHLPRVRPRAQVRGGGAVRGPRRKKRPGHSARRKSKHACRKGAIHHAPTRLSFRRLALRAGVKKAIGREGGKESLDCVEEASKSRAIAYLEIVSPMESCE